MKRSITELSKLDSKWLGRWKNLPLGTSINPRKLAQPTKGKKFIVPMFPYPSGVLHMGHLRVYTISDVLSRFFRMRGYDVVHPMGWDAFGLPAENAAIERKIDPATWTKSNIAKMKSQMASMLADFDWEREVTTCDPEYYKWTQKLFLLMHEHGLAYKKKAEINWDPIDQTVLANEQVDAQGRSWRSGALVEKKSLEQWFLGITKFAPELKADLDILEEWPSEVKTMQTNWIGESNGTTVTFLFNEQSQKSANSQSITTFTTRVDTLFSVQYVALALDHEITKEVAEGDHNLRSFIRDQKLTEQEDSKAGFQIKGLYVINPIDPDLPKIPVFVAPYVISGYGEGAVMGCPAHDERDFEFWRQNMGGNAPIMRSVEPLEGTQEEGPYTGKEGVLNTNAGKFSGLTTKEALKAMQSQLVATNLGTPTTKYKIRDWLISRQRYWGAPIPIVYCDDCGTVPVPDEQLPVLLPKVDALVGKNGSALSNIPEFVNCECPSCGGHAKRDTDTMDTFMDSSWYLFRYADAKNRNAIFDKEKANSLLPVDMYIGGVEHAILHLLYTRFVSKFLSSTGEWTNKEFNGEPIRRLVTQGMVHGKTYVNPDNKRFLKPDEVDLTGPQPVVKETGKIASITFEKMSKSKYNGADPEECILKYGADSTRGHILFQAPVTDVLDWDETKIVGIQRWLRKVLTLAETIGNSKSAPELDLGKLNAAETNLFNTVQNTIVSVTNSFSKTLTLNTVISDYMKLTNKLVEDGQNSEISGIVLRYSFLELIRLMAPVTPSAAEEAYEIYCGASHLEWTSILQADWPVPAPLIGTNTHDYKVMINGKFRFSHSAEKTLGKDDLITKVIESANGRKYVGDKTIKNVIVKKDAIVIIVK
ncbi:unnamed protein product [Kuraishia capsulata CBS 1993]|uniref:leucine--tRNA ligase n=1 Tax=Kuraishia capsulata CBS 1993 TaxID=1382522 RepID=W6MUK9_9ASCO|nr:uncharacterized protein KUCA_T00001690001 [Kuraishia capsulata CBS 1993]CDK25720.1 unnamed protein product [Kuraishia capsulata CBS 1993]